MLKNEECSDADSALTIMTESLHPRVTVSFAHMRKILSSQVTQWTFEEHQRRLSQISRFETFANACTYHVPLQSVMKDPTYALTPMDIFHMGHELMFCPIIVGPIGVIFSTRGVRLVDSLYKGIIPAIVFVIKLGRYNGHNKMGLVQYMDLDAAMKTDLARAYGLPTRSSPRLTNDWPVAQSEDGPFETDEDSTDSDHEVSTLENLRRIRCRTKRYQDKRNNITSTILQNLATQYGIDCQNDLIDMVATHEVQHDIPAYNESAQVYEIEKLMDMRPGSHDEEDHYLVKWARSSNSTWEPESGLPGPLLAGYNSVGVWLRPLPP
jgi:hypothetical protein